MQIKSLVILGPTASGKTQLSLKLSQSFNSEIINCDTSIFYKYLSIGTGKPNKKNLKLVKHNLLDFLEPDQDYSLAEFLNDANNIINKIVSDNKVPILVGGSGQYLKALIENWNVSNIENMSELFLGAKKFNQPLNKWNVNNDNNMVCMFGGASSFNQNISNWDISDIKDDFMFKEAILMEEKHKPIIYHLFQK